MNVIFDCDNTFGVPGCDVDDGLALLYLLGSENANLLGITNTYGNSDIDKVYKATRKMLKEIGRKDIPQMKGCSRDGEVQSEAVDFLVETVNRYSGDISILATGSLTNLLGAYKKDVDFFNKVSQIILMGGITETLFINGTMLNELNFSCDPVATFQVLAKAQRVAIATGNNCLDAYFSLDGFDQRFGNSPEPIARYIYEKTAYWYDYNRKNFGIHGFYNWDVTAAAYLLNPEMFKANRTSISPDLDSLERGFLYGSGNPIEVNLPKILDKFAFEEHIYSTYLNVKMLV